MSDDAEARLTSGERLEEDTGEGTLRPQSLDDFVGQRGLRENLKVFIDAARSRAESLDHTLFYGPPGLGKTTLARAVTDSLRSPVQWVASTQSSRSIPLGVFSHLVGSTGSRDATALLATARESLVTQGSNNIVGVDDAHLLDELSATLLHLCAGAVDAATLAGLVEGV